MSGTIEIIPGAIEVKVTVEGKNRSLFFGADDLKVVEDAVFLKLATARSNIRTLLSLKSEVARKNAFMACTKTTVVDMLRTAKSNRLRELTLEGVSGKSGASALRCKKAKGNKLLIPEIVTIDAPSIDGVDGVRMRVLSHGSHTHAAIWMELVEVNIDYLTDAIAAQLSSSQPQSSKKARTSSPASIIGSPEVGYATPSKESETSIADESQS